MIVFPSVGYAAVQGICTNKCEGGEMKPRVTVLNHWDSLCACVNTTLTDLPQPGKTPIIPSVERLTVWVTHLQGPPSGGKSRELQDLKSFSKAFFSKRIALYHWIRPSFVPRAKIHLGQGSTSFLWVCELRTVCTFFNGWGKKSKEYFVTHENYMKFKFQWWQIKLYKKTAILTCLHIFYGCFHTITAELNICNKDHMAHKVKNIYCLAFYRRCLPILL